MSKILVAYLAAFFTLLPFLSLAEEMRVFPQNIDNEEYVCFDDTSAWKLLQMRIDFPKLQLKLNKQTKLIELKTEEISVLLNMNDNLDEQVTLVTKQKVALEMKINRLDAWYKSWWFWLGVGVLVGTGTTIGVVYAVKEAK